MSQSFKIVEVNPNQATGGGGCLCSPTETPDTEGPFAVFYAQEMADNISPHPVICAGCAREVVKQLDKNDATAGGEEVSTAPKAEAQEPDSGSTPEPSTEDEGKDIVPVI